MGTRRVEETRAVSSEAALVVTKSGLHFKPSEAAWRRTARLASSDRFVVEQTSRVRKNNIPLDRASLIMTKNYSAKMKDEMAKRRNRMKAEARPWVACGRAGLKSETRPSS